MAKETNATNKNTKGEKSEKSKTVKTTKDNTKASKKKDTKVTSKNVKSESTNEKVEHSKKEMKTVKTGDSKKKHAKKQMSATLVGQDNEGIKLFKVVLVVLLCFVIFWGITYFVTEKRGSSSDGDGSANEKIADIQYDKILVGTMLKQKRSEYYVMLDKMSEDSYAIYETYLSIYSAQENATKIYTVDMDDPFNKMYYGETSNFDFENLSDFRINQITLLHIKDEEVVDTYEGKDEVLKQLKDMTK